MLTPEEQKRYDRQMMIPEVGEKGQEKLKSSKVFIAGAGGLGSPIAIYLSVAGVGNIKIVDNDTVELSNLNRQILHWDEDIGKNKVDSAKHKLMKLNPSIKLDVLCETIGEDNVSELVDDSDLIIDAMDNLPTRYLLNRTAIEKDIPFFHGAVSGLEGRVMTVIPGKSACLRCSYRGQVPAEKFSVMGVTPAIIGSIQATEVIKYITGMGELLTNRLLRYDGMSMDFHEFRVGRNPQCEDCGHLK
ncbi:ThiF family adenylyltransferase [Thermodesulfobacteriota bacterium]